MSRVHAGGISDLANGEDGVASVEAALVLPFVLVLGMGAIEFGWLMVQIQGVQTALRDAGRYTSRAALIQTAPGNYEISDSTENAAVAIVQQAYQSNGINSEDPTFTLFKIDNESGGYLGGSVVYRIDAAADFTPASVGMLQMIGITLPQISLRYQVRHAGG